MSKKTNPYFTPERSKLIGEKIRTHRLQKNMTQTDVAKIINVTAETIRKYEKGMINDIPNQKLFPICKALEIPLSEIYQAETMAELMSQFEPEVTISGKAKDKYIIIRKSNFTPEQILQIENFIAFIRSQNKQQSE